MHIDASPSVHLNRLVSLILPDSEKRRVVKKQWILFFVVVVCSVIVGCSSMYVAPNLLKSRSSIAGILGATGFIWIPMSSIPLGLAIDLYWNILIRKRLRACVCWNCTYDLSSNVRASGIVVCPECGRASEYRGVSDNS